MIIGTTSGNGYPLGMEERFDLTARAGFGAVMLWWGEGEPLTRRQRVRLNCAWKMPTPPPKG